MGIEEVGILIFVVALASVLIWATYQYVSFYKKYHLVCPKCGHEFKPPVLKMVLAPNYVSGKYIKCPNCNVKDYCDSKPDKKANEVD